MGTIAVGASAGSSPSGICATIDEFSLEKQTNVNAERILAQCRGGSGGFIAGGFSAVDRLTGASPDVYGGVDKNLITGGPEAFPNVTQSEVQVWAQGNHLVAAY